ncbi:tautomerase family protein [Curtobacterium ammoniigenes]|uniref:tautomerase family protein n=1 Tax=Curtobacterium ammoniigenes TaxID=395387 RepID=UPI000835E8F3|nr:tautomerase family protein [Curtobacterium ammoniigenes]
MPLVRIDLIAGREPDQVRGIGDAIHAALVSTYGIPERDHFQIITEHAASNIVAEDAGLGFERSDGVVMIQIFTQQGRSQAAKQELFAAINAGLEAVDVRPEGTFVSYIENKPEDWSFGFERAQYVTGELAFPDAN